MPLISVAIISVATILNKLKELPTQIPQAIAAGIEKIAEWGASMKEKGGTVITEFITSLAFATMFAPHVATLVTAPMMQFQILAGVSFTMV